MCFLGVTLWYNYYTEFLKGDSKFHKAKFLIMIENDLSNKIIGCAIEVQKEKPMPIVYKEVRLDHGYRIDLLVEEKVVIEIKTVEALNDVHTAQVLTYLKLSNYKLGLLLNFHVSILKAGIRRIIN